MSDEPEFTKIAPSMFEDKPKQKRGFAVMDPERRKLIAAMGGAAVQPHNRSFSQNRDLAAAAGKKGGTNGHGGGRPKRESIDD